MKTRYRLAAVNEFNDLDARDFDLQPPNELKRVFVVRKGEAFFAYRNICPHAGAPLNWYGDRFLNFEQTHLICALHGATFQIEDGFCIDGPCTNNSLESIPLIFENGQIIVEL